MIRLGRLKTPAQFFHTENFEAWDREEDTFTASFVGRLYPFDRFKTIYHRPTRRETLGVSENISLPTSMVVRHTSTQEIFIVSETAKRDSDMDAIYDTAYALHRPIGKGELIRPMTLGTGDDLGPLVDARLGPIYFDLELRTGEDLPLASDQMKGRFFITLPTDPIVKQGDFITFCNESYQMNLMYMDGGFQMARGDNVFDEREDMIYHLKAGSGASYNPATGTYTPQTESDRVFTGTVHPVSINDEQDVIVPQDRITIYIGKAHIGFTPRINGELTRAGIRYSIYDITTGVETNQWVIKCREAK